MMYSYSYGSLAESIISKLKITLGEVNYITNAKDVSNRHL